MGQKLSGRVAAEKRKPFRIAPAVWDYVAGAFVLILLAWVVTVAIVTVRLAKFQFASAFA